MFGPESTRRLPLTLGVLIALGCASCDDEGTDTQDDPAVTDPMEEEDAGTTPDEEEELPADEEPDAEAEEEEKDAGAAAPDAAKPPSKDAGTADAGTDAGVSKPDAGSAKPDAGTSSDAGPKPDASTDSGMKPDTGSAGNEAFLRGEELVADNACGSCHQENFAGTAFYPNITPDVATGIGGWTDAQIIAAVNTGKGADGARLCALMQRYSFTEAELTDLITYLRGIPAIENEIDSVCPGHGK
jgi:hypothetical protein